MTWLPSAKCDPEVVRPRHSMWQKAMLVTKFTYLTC